MLLGKYYALVMLMKDIQNNLLSAFESSGLTYDELAKRTNLPKSALYRYINGDTEKIPIDRFQSICAELHIDASALLGWSDKPPEDPLTRQHSPEGIRILSIIDKMPPEQRARAEQLLQVAFAEYFKEDNT